MSADETEKGERRRQAAKTGALSRVLQDVKDNRPDATEIRENFEGAGRPTVARDRQVYFPSKGAARIPTSACRPWRFSDRL